MAILIAERISVKIGRNCVLGRHYWAQFQQFVLPHNHRRGTPKTPATAMSTATVITNKTPIKSVT